VSSRKRQITRKLAAAGLGLGFVIVALEFSLFAAHHIFLSRQEASAKAKISGDPGEIRILAIGESTTAVSGDDETGALVSATSYPAQLETVLNSRQSKFRFVVINRGTMGSDSDRVIDQLESDIRRYRPHIVLAMMGMMDSRLSGQEAGAGAGGWTGLKTFKLLGLVKEAIAQKRSLDQIAIMTAMESIPPSSRDQVDREFARHFHGGQGEVSVLSAQDWAELKEAAERAIFYYLDGQLAVAEHLVGQLIGRWGFGHNIQASIYFREGRFREAENILRQGIEARPSFSANYVDLGRHLSVSGAHGEAESILKKAVELNPEDLRATYALADVLKMQKKYRPAINLLEALPSPEEWRRIGRVARGAQVEPPRLMRGSSIYFHNMVMLGELYYLSGDPGRAESLLTKVPFLNHVPIQFQILSRIYRERGDLERERQLRAEIAKAAGRLGEYFEMSRMYTGSDRKEKIDELFAAVSAEIPATARNFRRAQEMAMAAGARIYFVQYPTFPAEILKHFLPAPAEKGRRAAVIDNESIFLNMAPREVFVEPRFPYAFVHYTRKGSKILAENVASRILADFNAGQEPSEQDMASASREPLRVGPARYEKITHVMRQNLVWFERILSAMARDDHEELLASVRSFGTNKLSGRGFPAAWRAIGAAMHEEIDMLAQEIEAKSGNAAYISRLSRITSSCVACHGKFKLEREGRGREASTEILRRMNEYFPETSADARCHRFLPSSGNGSC
jgi:tetratricopeptide (TPR) repeat protein